MRGYKITTRHHGHICYECSRSINLHAPAVMDLTLPGGIVGQRAYFHPDCYKETQLDPHLADYREFEDALYQISQSPDKAIVKEGV